MPLTDNWLTWLGLIFDVFGNADWLNVLLIGTAFVIVLLLLIGQFHPGDGFDMRSLVARRSFDSGREFWTVDPGKCYQFGGFLVTTWGFIALIGKGALSDMYLAIYAVAWLASPGINQIVASKFPVAPGSVIPDATPASGSVTTTTTTEVKP